MENAVIPNVTLADGNTIPQLGFGTYKISNDQAQCAVEAAFEAGYRHFDTAQMYGNEAGIGTALAAIGVGRKEIFLTTKINNGNHLPEDVFSSFAASLEALRTDYVDLLLIHWPLPTLYGGDFVQTWEALIQIKERGQARSIGVSNFEPAHLERIISATAVAPVINQIEAHPYFANNVTRAASVEVGAAVQAWSPLGRGGVLSDPVVLAVARKLGRTPAQVVLRWALERGDIIFPKTTSPARMVENAAIFDFSLGVEFTRQLDGLDQGEGGRTGRHPNVMDFVG